MITVYIGAAFIAGLVIGGILARARVEVKLGTVEIRAGSTKEVCQLMRFMTDNASKFQAAAVQK